MMLQLLVLALYGMRLGAILCKYQGTYSTHRVSLVSTVHTSTFLIVKFCCYQLAATLLINITNGVRITNVFLSISSVIYSCVHSHTVEPGARQDISIQHNVILLCSEDCCRVQNPVN